jgi:sugar lactone lactonase YvrE
MTFYRAFYILSIAVVFFSIHLLPVFGVTTQMWQQQHQKDFESGKPENVSLSSKGELMLAPKLDTFFGDTKEIYVWCLAEDSKGNIYAGTGNRGKIYRITPDGQSSLFYDSPEVSILALAIDPNDNIYAGTAPDGLIYKLTDSSTPPTTILSSEEKYVWAMTFDDAGNLYAATGTSGKIYKITPDGQTSVLYDSDETNILCLLYHQDMLYAGSDGKGTIYSVKTVDGAATVIYQTGQKEVRRLVIGAQGVIYAGTITTEAPRPGGPPPPPVPAPPSGRNGEEKKSRVYKIEPDGIVSVMWEVPEPLILSMASDSEEGLYIGTGDSGKLYWVNTDGDSVFKGKCGASQIVAIHRTANSNQLLLATGNAGKIFELKSDYLAEGTLESKAHDTKVVSRWGKLSWEGVTPEGTAISVATRSGNTEKPNNTWNNWSEELTAPEAQITSPAARYIQWRAKLTTSAVAATPVLKKVTVASVQANTEPRFTSIQVRRGGAPESSGPSEGGRRPRESRPSPNPNSDGDSTKYTASWKVKDDNNDTLQFNVYYRGVEETNWKLLKEELKTSSYALDTTLMSDGRYVIKVNATDKLSNPPNFAKSTEKVSDPFDIDNSQPSVTEITATVNEDQTYQISCTAADPFSYIQKAVYKIDSDEEWQVIFPDDGIFDSKQENLLLHTNSLPAGEHTITIRVTDAAGNTGVGRATF